MDGGTALGANHFKGIFKGIFEGILEGIVEKPSVAFNYSRGSSLGGAC